MDRKGSVSGSTVELEEDNHSVRSVVKGREDGRAFEGGRSSWEEGGEGELERNKGGRLSFPLHDQPFLPIYSQ